MTCEVCFKPCEGRRCKKHPEVVDLLYKENLTRHFCQSLELHLISPNPYNTWKAIQKSWEYLNDLMMRD